MLLVDRYVRFEDELLAVVEESGQPSLDQRIESVLDSLPADSMSCSEEERDAAIDAEITRYMDEVAEPAFATLRERRRARPSAVRKVPPPIACANAAYYSELLDGIEPCLSPPDGGAPSVAWLTLRTSWAPKHPVRSYPLSAYIAGSDGAYLVLYFGSHRPCSPDLGFYLVYDASANSVSIVPPLSPSGSHAGLANELAILGIRKEPEPHHPCPCFYVLAELLFTMESHSHLPSNKGTLFTWWSPGSGPLATGRWIQRDVVLPIPADDDDEGTTSTTPTYSFHADMVISVSGRGICWVDLLKGILLCDCLDRLAAGDGDDDATVDDAPVFYFIPLPDGCAIKRDFQDQPEEYRSMCSISSELLRFVSLDGYREGYPIDEVVFRTWNLSLPRGTGTPWRWEMVLESCVDIWNDPIYKNDLKLQPLMPSFPTISTTEPDIVYLLLTDFKLERGWTVATASYVFSLDVRHRNIASAIRLPCDEDGFVQPLKIFASHLNKAHLNKEMILCRSRLDLTDRSITGQETIAHEGESRGKFSKWTLCEEDEDPLMTYTLGARRGKLAKWNSCEENESPMPYTLEAHFATLKFCQDGLGGRRIISSLGASPSGAKFEPSSSVGLHCAFSQCREELSRSG